MQHDVAKLLFGRIAQAQQARLMSLEHFSVDGTTQSGQRPVVSQNSTNPSRARSRARGAAVTVSDSELDALTAREGPHTP